MQGLICPIPSDEVEASIKHCRTESSPESSPEPDGLGYSIDGSGDQAPLQKKSTSKSSSRRKKKALRKKVAKMILEKNGGVLDQSTKHLEAHVERYEARITNTSFDVKKHLDCQSIRIHHNMPEDNEMLKGDEKIQYSRDFLLSLQFIRESLVKPALLLHIPDIVGNEQSESKWRMLHKVDRFEPGITTIIIKAKKDAEEKETGKGNKIQYSRDFILSLQFINESLVKPEGLQQFPDIVRNELEQVCGLPHTLIGTPKLGPDGQFQLPAGILDDLTPPGICCHCLKVHSMSKQYREQLFIKRHLINPEQVPNDTDGWMDLYWKSNMYRKQHKLNKKNSFIVSSISDFRNNFSTMDSFRLKDFTPAKCQSPVYWSRNRMTVYDVRGNATIQKQFTFVAVAIDEDKTILHLHLYSPSIPAGHPAEDESP